VIIERHIVRHVVEHQRRAGLDGFACERDGGERLNIKLDGFGGLLGLDRGLRHHAGDRVTSEPHLVDGKRRPRRLLHRGAVAVLQRRHAFKRAVPGGLQIGARIDREHARHRQRRRGIDALEHAMGMARAHDRRIGLTRKAHVVGIAAVALHQDRVLGAQYRLADAELLHRPGIGIVLNIHDNSLK
jgi:hypothetical protein